MSNQIAPKTLWCPTCKEFPDEIIEHYNNISEIRKWDRVDTYELIDTDGWDLSETLCKKCNTILIEKEEGGNSDGLSQTEIQKSNVNG